MAPRKVEPETESGISLRIGIVLFGESVGQFEAVKKRFGILSNSDVIRFLVRDKFEQIINSAAPTSPALVTR